MGELKTIELHQAFMWTCDNCGSEHLARAIRLGPKEAEARGLDPGLAKDGCWLVAPKEVSCRYCGRKYQTVEP